MHGIANAEIIDVIIWKCTVKGIGVPPSMA